MRRFLLAASLGLGLVATAAPAANACSWTYCPGTSIVCAEMGGCPLYCTRVPVAERTVCIGR